MGVPAQAAATKATADIPAAEPVSTPARPKWLLGGMLRLAETQPRRLLRIAYKLLDPERVRRVSRNPAQAFDWQTRLAMVSALSSLFDPAQNKSLGTDAAKLREHARTLLNRSMNEDTSLLVRDGAVESVRRILRMDPREAKLWKVPLETAFLDTRNHIEGEGLFIRETILTALREGSLSLSKKVRRAAERDANPQVKSLLRNWDTSAYDEL